MRLNNAKRGCWHKYDILYANGRWVAWYYPAIETAEEKAKATNELTNEIKLGGDR
jgi:hypothetical protein